MHRRWSKSSGPCKPVTNAQRAILQSGLANGVTHETTKECACHAVTKMQHLVDCGSWWCHVCSCPATGRACTACSSSPQPQVLCSYASHQNGKVVITNLLDLLAYASESATPIALELVEEAKRYLRLNLKTLQKQLPLMVTAFAEKHPEVCQSILVHQRCIGHTLICVLAYTVVCCPYGNQQ